MAVGRQDFFTRVMLGGEYGTVRPSVPCHTEEGPQQDRMRATQREAERGLKGRERQTAGEIEEWCTVTILFETQPSLPLISQWTRAFPTL